MQIRSTGPRPVPAAAFSGAIRPVVPDAVHFGWKSKEKTAPGIFSPEQYFSTEKTAEALFDLHQQRTERYNSDVKDKKAELVSPLLLASIIGKQTEEAYQAFKGSEPKAREKFDFSRLDVKLEDLEERFNLEQDVELALKDLFAQGLMMKGDQDETVMLTDRGWAFFEAGLLADIATAPDLSQMHDRLDIAEAKAAPATEKRPSLDQIRFDKMKKKLSIMDKMTYAMIQNKGNLLAWTGAGGVYDYLSITHHNPSIALFFYMISLFGGMDFISKARKNIKAAKQNELEEAKNKLTKPPEELDPAQKLPEAGKGENPGKP